VPHPDALTRFLPDLRRFAAALTGSPRSRADELVLRALRDVMVKAPEAGDGAGDDQLKRGLRANLAHLAHVQVPRHPAANANAFETALLDLPSTHRAALILICVEDCTYEEAAQTLGVNRAVLIGRLAAARQLMARRLQEEARSDEAPPYLRLVK